LWRSGTQKQVFDRKIATKTINIGLTQIIILNFKANLTPAKTGVLTWDELDFSMSGFLKSAQDVIYNLPPRVDALQTLCFA
jgi:hypothetical protein